MMDDGTDQRLAARIIRLKAHWRSILLAGSVCAAAALVASLVLPKVYRATTFILVSESRLGDSSEDRNLQQMAMLPTFVPFVDSDTLILDALRELRLDQPPYELTVDLVRRRGYLDVRTPKSTRLLELRIEFPDPEIAADLANEIAGGAVRFNEHLNTADTTAAREFLKRQMDRSIAAQDEVLARRHAVLEEARIEDRERDLQTLLNEKERLAVRLGELTLGLAQNGSRIESLETILASEPKVITLTKSILSDRLLEVAVEATAPDETPLAITEESVNETRTIVRQSLIEANVEVTADRAEMEIVNGRLGRVGEEIITLMHEITGLKARIETVDQDYERAVEATRSASLEYQAATVKVGSKALDMKQISPALPPRRPVRPQPLFNAAMGFLVGALLSGGIAVAHQSIRDLTRYRETP
jgi:succinoglycan biosynthesis transport protein ExoP